MTMKNDPLPRFQKHCPFSQTSETNAQKEDGGVEKEYTWKYCAFSPCHKA
jgi:hypothetical protein